MTPGYATATNITVRQNHEGKTVQDTPFILHCQAAKIIFYLSRFARKSDSYSFSFADCPVQSGSRQLSVASPFHNGLSKL
jgi:hypothetical protein